MRVDGCFYFIFKSLYLKIYEYAMLMNLRVRFFWMISLFCTFYLHFYLKINQY